MLIDRFWGSRISKCPVGTPKTVLQCDLYPTNPFTFVEAQDQEIGEFYVVQERRATDFKDPKFCKDHIGFYVSDTRAKDSHGFSFFFSFHFL